MDLVKFASLKEAYEYKKDNENAAYLLGATEVFRLNSSVKADMIISLNHLIEKKVEERGDELFISANQTFDALIKNPLVPDALKDACLKLSSQALRNQATIGGNIGAMRSDSYLIPTLLAFDASLVVSSSKEKVCKLSNYINNGGCNCIILGVLIKKNTKVVNKRVALTSSSHAAITAALSEYGYFTAISGGKIYISLEGALNDNIQDDLTGSKEYKKYLASEINNILKGDLND